MMLARLKLLPLSFSPWGSFTITDEPGSCSDSLITTSICLCASDSAGSSLVQFKCRCDVVRVSTCLALILITPLSHTQFVLK